MLWCFCLTLIMITPGSMHDRGYNILQLNLMRLSDCHILNTSFIFGGFTISPKFTPLKSNIETTKMMVWKMYRLSTIVIFGIHVKISGCTWLTTLGFLRLSSWKKNNEFSCSSFIPFLFLDIFGTGSVIAWNWLKKEICTLKKSEVVFDSQNGAQSRK